jgi:hypothetical protein
VSHNEFKSASGKTWTHLSAPIKARINSAQHMQREFVTHRNTVDTIDIPWSSSKKSMDCRVKRTAVGMTALDFA